MDFSEYQGPSQEWESFAQQNPPPVRDPSIPPHVMRQITNGVRVTASQAELKADDLLSRVASHDYSILTRDKQNITARTYRPKNAQPTDCLPIYLYFHGGGHLFGCVESEDAACSRVCANSGVMVVNVGYRHTPEFQHPTQVNDAWDSFEWLSKNYSSLGGDPTRVIVGGVSAGAGLAASIVIRQHELGLQNESSRAGVHIKGQLLCIPWLIHPDNNPFRSQPKSSYQQNSESPVLPMPILQLFTDLLGAEDPTDALLNVALIDEKGLSGLPKASFLVAGQDILRDDGLYFAHKLTSNGVPTKVHIFPGLPHGFRRFNSLSSSRRWDELLVESCHWILSDDSASSVSVIE